MGGTEVRRANRRLGFAALALAIALASGCNPSTDPPAEAGLQPTGLTQAARVIEVIDGDTIRVSLDGREHRLRYIGIDSPELARAGLPAEWQADAAIQANRSLVDGRSVVLERDVSETDRFGRLLRYVWLKGDEGWLLVNFELVRLGFAHAVTFPPDVKYGELLREAEREARAAGRGLWADPQADVVP